MNRKVRKYLSSGFLLILAIIFSTCIAATPVEAQIPDSSHYMAVSGNRGWQTLNIRKGSYLKHALQQLKRYYRVVFFYRDDAVAGKKVTRDVTALPGNLDKALKRVLEGQGLVFNQLNDRTYGIYSKKKIAPMEGLIIPPTTVHIHPKVYLANKIVSRQATVSGTVTDAQTGKPLIGVNILVVGTSTGTVTDVNGHYSLTVPSLQDTLRFSFIGYRTKKVPVNGRTTVNVAMKSKVTGLNQLVVTAQGGLTSKKKLGISITTIGTKQIKNAGVSSIGEVLSGKILGGTVSRYSGGPAGGFRIRLHGTSTILGNASPLYVIDGAIVSNSTAQVLLTGGTSTSRIADFNPLDFKSISVVDGAAAAALYGSRANNGVVIIKTKMGQAGEHNIFYSSSFSLHHIRKKLNVNMAKMIKDNSLIIMEIFFTVNVTIYKIKYLELLLGPVNILHFLEVHINSAIIYQVPIRITKESKRKRISGGLHYVLILKGISQRRLKLLFI